MPSFNRRINQQMRRLQASETGMPLLMAAALGLMTGLVIWLFQHAIEWVHAGAARAEAWMDPWVGAASVILVLAAAGALVGWIMDRFIGEERHHGVAGVIEAVALAGGRLRYRRIAFKGVASAISLGAGASVGPEDPSVQIGANLGSWFGQALHLKEDHVRLMVAAGAASAISAAFGAPIAGVFFALEVILNGTFETRSFGIVVLASVMSSAVMSALRSAPEMGPYSFVLGSPLEIPLFVPLGVLLAGLSVIMVRTIYWQHDLWHKYVHLPRPATTALAGVLVGVVAIFLPQIMGIGRETMSGVLGGEISYSLAMLLTLAVAKIIMTAVSMAGGFVGGVFAPALFVGTMVGSLYGRMVVSILPQSNTTDEQAYAIVGMAAMMAGVVRSPITAIMLVFELTNDYRLILPIMLATVVCVYAAERVEPLGIYTMSLLRRGVRLPQGREVDLMQGVRVADAMLKPAPTIAATADLSTLRDTLRRSGGGSLCVVDEEGLLAGVVTLSDLQRAFHGEAGKELPQTVAEICSHKVVTVYPDNYVWEAIRLMSAHDIGRLPVVKRGSREVVGFFGRHGVVRAYQLAILQRTSDQHVMEEIRLNTLTGGHFHEVHIESGSALEGKRIAEVVWPQEAIVAAVRRNSRILVPRGSTELLAGDYLTVVAARSADRALDDLARGKE